MKFKGKSEKKEREREKYAVIESKHAARFNRYFGKTVKSKLSVVNVRCFSVFYLEVELSKGFQTFIATIIIIIIKRTAVYTTNLKIEEFFLPSSIKTQERERERRREK